MLRVPDGVTGPLISYRGTVAWRAAPLRVQAKARVHAGIVDVHVQLVVSPDVSKPLTKVSVVVEVPKAAVTDTSVLRSVLKPEGAVQSTDDKISLSWTLAALSPDSTTVLQGRLQVSAGAAGDDTAASAAEPKVVALRAQAGYACSSMSATQIKMDVEGCDVTVVEMLLVKCAFLPA
jgi:hypothetical protein